MKRIQKAAALVFIAAFALSGCALIPKEEVYQKSPRLQDETPVQYKLSYVMRGDIADIESISCRYRSVREETLAFRVGGEFYEGIYVTKGDYVEDKQVLASLQMDVLHEEEKQLELESKRLQLLRAQLLENKTAALERLRVEFAGENEGDALIKLEEDYQGQLRDLDDQILYTSLRLSELKEDMAKRQLVATLDGTVMYVRTVHEGDRSVEGERFIRVADTSSAVFVGETAYPECFHEGDLIEITAGGTQVPARVASPESLGVEETPDEDKKKTEVYFVPLELNAELEDGDRGQLKVTKEARTDVLYVLAKAVVTIDGRDAVYTLDEYGLKTIRYIKTGLQTGSEIEILEGLVEGEAVVVG